MKRRKWSERGKKPNSSHRFSAWLHTAGAKCALIVLIGSLLLMGMFCLACAPVRYHLTVGTTAHQTITATKDVVDEISTEEKRREKAAAVEPTYHLQEGVSDEVINQLNKVFDELRTVQQYGLTLRDAGDTADTIRNRSFSDSEIEYAQKLVTTFVLTRYQATTLLRTETADFNDMVSTVNTAVVNSLNTTIREGQVNQAITTITQIVGFRVDISLVQNVLPAVLRASIRANMVTDQATTAQAQQAARDEVDDIVYHQGDYIVREGDTIAPNQVEMLRKLGLLEDTDFDYSIYGGGVLLVLAALTMMLLLLRLLRPELLHDPRRMAVMMMVIIVSMGLCIGALKAIHVYLAPVAMGALLLTALLGWQAGIPGGVCLSMMVSGLAAGGSSTTPTEVVMLLIMGLVGSTLSVWLLNGKWQRMRVMLCGLIAAVANAVLLVSMALMTSSRVGSLTPNVYWAIGGGLLSGIAALGLQPVFEGAFNLATPSKLMELGNQNHPLLRRLMLEAPGTYHHSMVVANLTEAAAEKIGANALLARTGAYFHDVGKLKRPLYFKENQMGENPLDLTDPYVSAAIVTSHTRDGFLMTQKYHLPPEIQQIVAEHHGDTPVMFFYHRALQQSDGKPVDINDFRYDGTRPATKEAAIVMLADTIEAAVRSMSDPTPKAIEEFIEHLVRGKLEDGQLSNSPLTLRDIDGICEAFNTVLNGVFHERIEYPKAEIPKRGAFMNHDDEQPAAAPAEAAVSAAQETAAAEQAAVPETTEEDDHDPVVGN